MADIFSKYSRIHSIRDNILNIAQMDPLAIRIEKILSPTTALINQKGCILLGSNNYLGLTMDEQAIEASCQATRLAGTGTTGSRVANGSYASHQNLEKQIAEFFGCGHAILFTTGYQANVGFLSAIAGKDDYVLIDSDSHASIYDGCKLCNGTVLHFRHNNPQDLENRLKRLPKEANKLVVTEGIFSMRGDIAPLKEIAAVTKKYNAYLMVDEAHSLGVFGNRGRGLVEELGVEEDVDFIVGTFSKSVGTIGGFCASNHEGLNAVRFAARAYLFTASLPPSVVASAAQTLKRVENGSDLRDRLWENAGILYEGLKEMDFDVGPDKTPIIGVIMPDMEVGLRAWRALLDNGVYVNLALPPATPEGTCLLRCSVCAAHTKEQLEQVLAVFAKIKDTMNICKKAA